MNYILAQLNRKISFLESAGKTQELKVHYQAKFEFYLNLMLGYLWNKNWDELEPDDKEYVINCILKPSIGSVIATSRRLDVNSEFFGDKKLKKFYQSIDDYPSLRNEKIGHGFSYEDDTINTLQIFESLFEKIDEAEIPLFSNDLDFIKIQGKKENIYYGTSYKPDGASYITWSCPEEVQHFKDGGLYLFDGSKYFKVNPFIYIEEEGEMYLFCSVDEKLTGRIKYNRLIKTGKKFVDVKELRSISITDEGHKRRTSNGTIINNYKNNYRKYIDVGIAKKLLSFLTSNRSTVFATLWGHGGVGKTASIQYVCEVLSNKENKEFDYIIFLSAKDRFYNYYQGKIEKLEDSITTYDQIVSYINNILTNYSSLNEEYIINFDGKLLIVIDDFETFSKSEKDKIIEFVKRLNINHHKVILTTRAATLITGEEIQTTELGEDETIKFLESAIENEILTYSPFVLKKELKRNEFRKKIHDITSGRPLFILQFAVLLGQKANLQEAILSDIKSTDEAKNFLYDRIYDYLSQDAKNMFLAISLLVSEDDLSALIESLKFLLNKEDKIDEFQAALNELIKLKIIVIEDREFFKVYSPEILKQMKLFYENKGNEYDSVITSRFALISSNKDLNTEYALLQTADASKMLSSEADVENKYRFILNRHKAPLKVKLKALLNCANYLFTFKGRQEKALKLFADFFHVFNSSPEYIKSYASYCWSEGSIDKKLKAIEILKNYFETKPRIDTETFLDLLGTLMTYTSIQLITERDELKEMYRFGDIAKADYTIRYKIQKERFDELFFGLGTRLYKKTINEDLMALSPSCRNSVLFGLTHFVEICVRVNKKDTAIKVCVKILEELPQNFHQPFESRLKRIEQLFGVTVKPEYYKPQIESDFALKLKESLMNK